MMEKEQARSNSDETVGDDVASSDNTRQASVPETGALTPEARRALAEAEERRAAAKTNAEAGGNAQTKELGGQDGPEPTRYGDWEKGGIVSDF